MFMFKTPSEERRWRRRRQRWRRRLQALHSALLEVLITGTWNDSSFFPFGNWRQSVLRLKSAAPWTPSSTWSSTFVSTWHSRLITELPHLTVSFIWPVLAGIWLLCSSPAGYNHITYMTIIVNVMQNSTLLWTVMSNTGSCLSCANECALGALFLDRFNMKPVWTEQFAMET